MPEDQFFIQKELLSLIPTVIVPFVLWYLNRSEKKSDRNQIDLYLKRLELIEKFKSVHNLFPDDAINIDQSIFEKELREVADFLRPELTENEQKVLSNFDQISTLRRRFLLFKPASIKVFFLQLGFFYFLFGTVTFPFIAFTDPEMSEDSYFLIISLFVIVIYAIILYFISNYSNRLQRKKLLQRNHS